MILKIISDGTSKGTKVVNSETGELVNGICEVDWHLNCNNLAVATIKVYADVELKCKDVVIEKIDALGIEAGASTYSEMQDDGKLKQVNREEKKQD